MYIPVKVILFAEELVLTEHVAGVQDVAVVVSMYWQLDTKLPVIM